MYHYTSFDGLIKIVSTGTLWASNIHYLNDGSEYGYAYSLLDSVLAEIEKAEPLRKEAFDQLRQALRADGRANVFVASFSSEGDLLSQWRAYCPAARGVSIGFDPWQITAAARTQNFILAECVYELTQQQSLVRSIVRDFILAYDETDKTAQDIATMIRGFAVWFRIIAPQLKDPAFAEELESRLISRDMAADHLNVRYRQGLSFIVPYFEFALPQNGDQRLHIRNSRWNH
jgi:hypothetical protein